MVSFLLPESRRYTADEKAEAQQRRQEAGRRMVDLLAFKAQLAHLDENDTRVLETDEAIQEQRQRVWRLEQRALEVDPRVDD